MHFYLLLILLKVTIKVTIRNYLPIFKYFLHILFIKVIKKQYIYAIGHYNKKMSNTTCFELKISVLQVNCVYKQSVCLHRCLLDHAERFRAGFPITNFDWSAQYIVYHVSRSRVKGQTFKTKMASSSKRRCTLAYKHTHTVANTSMFDIHLQQE